MVHAHAPHFLWPYAVCYAAHQLNLWPRVSHTEVSPTCLWTGSPGVALEFRVSVCLAHVRDTCVDKLSARTLPGVFLGFPIDAPEFDIYHPPLHQFFDSRDVSFDEYVSYYARCPHRGLSVFPLPFSLPPLLLLLPLLRYAHSTQVLPRHVCLTLPPPPWERGGLNVLCDHGSIAISCAWGWGGGGGQHQGGT
ncbi:unnamed protein product [Closterium sp. NIES-53]